MNTFARQSISKTLVKACTAAVLLVTCLNTYAADSNVEKQSENFRVETMSSLHADLTSSDFVTPSLDVFNTAVANAIITHNFRVETLNSMHADLKTTNFVAPSLDMFNAAVQNSSFSRKLRAETLNSIQADLNSYDYVGPSLDVLNVALENSKIEDTGTTEIWASVEEILPVIASLGSIEVEERDTLSREATQIALNFAIDALENAKTNLAENERLSL